MDAKTRAEKIREFSNWVWNSPQKTHNQIDDKLSEIIEEAERRLNKSVAVMGVTCVLAKEIATPKASAPPKKAKGIALQKCSGNHTGVPDGGVCLLDDLARRIGEMEVEK